MQKNKVAERLALNPWASTGTDGLAGLLGYMYPQLEKNISAKEQTTMPAMSTLENALINLVPHLIDSLRAAEKDVTYWKGMHDKRAGLCDVLTENVRQAEHTIKELEGKLAFMDETIGDLRAELQNLQRLYPAVEHVAQAKRPEARRSNKKMT